MRMVKSQPFMQFHKNNFIFNLLILNLKQKEMIFWDNIVMTEWHFWNEPSEKVIFKAEAWTLKLTHVYYTFLYHHF